MSYKSDPYICFNRLLASQAFQNEVVRSDQIALWAIGRPIESYKNASKLIKICITYCMLIRSCLLLFIWKKFCFNKIGS